MPQGGRYILCDRCKVTTFSLNLPWPKDGETMAAAREAGWRIVREHDVNFEEDACPACIALEGGIRPVGEPIATPDNKLSVIEIHEALIKCADVVIVDRRTRR